MDLDQSITVTALRINGVRYNLLAGWQAKSFEMYLYSQDEILVGTFTASRLSGFSVELGLTDNSYFNRVKRCLIEQRDNYIYELQGGLFCWKRKQNDGGVVIEGFVPVQPDTKPRSARPDLLEVLLTINRQLKYKIDQIKNGFDSIKSEYETCLKDTEEFLNLKADMEKAICEKFLKNLRVKKREVINLTFKEESDDDCAVTVKLVPRHVASEKSMVSMLNIMNSDTKRFYGEELLPKPSDYVLPEKKVCYFD